MLRFMAQMIVGAIIGIAFALAMALAYVADVFDSELREARNGTADGSAESLQRISFRT